MSNTPAPKLWIFIFPISMFVIGYRLGLSDYWYPLMYVFYGLGLVMTFLIAWAEIWNQFVYKTNAIQYLFDSARHLDKDRISDLLIAMGLKPIAEQYATSNMSVSKYDKQGSYTGTINYKDIPARPDQLAKLADGIINEHAPFSRPEWTASRGVFTDGEYRRLKDYLWQKKLIELINPANANAGYRFTPGTEGGIEFLESYLPSPAPTLEVVGNQ